MLLATLRALPGVKVWGLSLPAGLVAAAPAAVAAAVTATEQRARAIPGETDA